MKSLSWHPRKKVKYFFIKTAKFRRFTRYSYQLTHEDELAEAKKQYKEVRYRYRGTGLWLKFPNGKDPKLAERQWAQVRTPLFKKWFGDWETASLVDMSRSVWRDDKAPARINFIPSDKLKLEMEKLTGHEIQKVFITDSDVRHIKKNHGKNQRLQGQFDITPEDIALVPFVMNEVDTAEQGKPDKLENKKTVFEKQINGTAYAVSIERGSNKEQVITLGKR
jgi:hypothetical protein